MAKKKKKRLSYTNTTDVANKESLGVDFTSFSLPDGASLFKFDGEGTYRIDILPYEVGSLNPNAKEGQYHWELSFYVHRGLGPDNNSFVCPSKTKGDRCPICEYVAKKARDPKADPDLLKDLAPKRRQLFNIINLKEKEKGVQIWEYSFHLFGKALIKKLKHADEEDDYGRFFHLEDGLSLRLGVEQKSFAGNSFFEVVDIEFKPRSEQYDESILDEVHCLDELLIIEPYDKLKKIFLQTPTGDDEMEEDEDEDEEYTPKKSSSKKKASKKSKKKSSSEDDDVDWMELAERAEDEDDEAAWELLEAAKEHLEDIDPDDYSWEELAEMLMEKTNSSDESESEESEEEDEDEDESKIEEGSVVVHDEYGICEVVKVSKDGKKLTIEDEDEETHKVKASEVELYDDDDDTPF